jgi:hypothetical protein
MDIEVKRLTLKALEDNGEGEALFAVWGLPDLDGDISEVGWFGNGEQEVFMVPHHLMTSGQPPLAKGRIWERPSGAVYAFLMNLELETARAWHSHLKFDLREGIEPRQVWSYGFRVRAGGSTPRRDGSRGRLLHAVKETGKPGAIVLEVSPVLAAAQPLTHTLMAKQQGAPLTPAQQAEVRRCRANFVHREIIRLRAIVSHEANDQHAARALHAQFLQREVARLHGGW